MGNRRKVPVIQKTARTANDHELHVAPAQSSTPVIELASFSIATPLVTAGFFASGGLIGKSTAPTNSQIREITDHRHYLRLNGCWGACYETSCFVEHRFGWRRRDGVYQLSDGSPVFLHSWNEADDGTIIDGTADQFFTGHDVGVFAPGDRRRQDYRERYTLRHNPARTPWLADRPYIGSPDDEFWNGRYEARMLGPGWWLTDNRDYLQWLLESAAHYWMFGAKVKEYRDLGYSGLSSDA